MELKVESCDRLNKVKDSSKKKKNTNWLWWTPIILVIVIAALIYHGMVINNCKDVCSSHHLDYVGYQSSVLNKNYELCECREFSDHKYFLISKNPFKKFYEETNELLSKKKEMVIGDEKIYNNTGNLEE